MGYTIMAESAYTCDVTSALRSGETNGIAIRITNPGGRLDWPDWETLSWGGIDLQKGHGFGGLDRGLTIEAHGPVALSDAWVLNTPNVRRVRANAVVRNDGSKASVVTVRATVLDSKTGKAIGSAVSTPVRLAPGSETTVPLVLTCPKAALWSPGSPRLYRLRFDCGVERREVTFGFRWFASNGLGTNAVLRLNGDRIRVFSAISWGFWGINGLFPTPDLAAKEVAAAKRLGLNALNFHHNVGRAEVLDAQDRMGLLRYMEPAATERRAREASATPRRSSCGWSTTSAAIRRSSSTSFKTSGATSTRTIRASTTSCAVCTPRILAVPSFSRLA